MITAVYTVYGSKGNIIHEDRVFAKSIGAALTKVRVEIKKFRMSAGRLDPLRNTHDIEIYISKITERQLAAMQSVEKEKENDGVC